MPARQFNFDKNLIETDFRHPASDIQHSTFAFQHPSLLQKSIITAHMTDLLKYFVIVIVVWRLTHLISSEDGPFDVIIRLRKLMGNSFFGKLMDCFYCLSIWVGFFIALYIGSSLEEILILTIYYSGASLILEKLTNKNFV